MSWSSWGARLNVQSIVNQGLEQVSKLKEDVEKQFDQVVAASTTTQPPTSNPRASAAPSPDTALAPPSAAVAAALFGDPLPPLPPSAPPRSFDGKTRSAAVLASLAAPPKSTGGIPAASTSDGAASFSGHPTNVSSSNGNGHTAAEDFFGSFVPEKATAVDGQTVAPMPLRSDERIDGVASSSSAEVDGKLLSPAEDEIQGEQELEEKVGVDGGARGSDRVSEDVEEEGGEHQSIEELEFDAEVHDTLENTKDEQPLEHGHADVASEQDAEEQEDEEEEAQANGHALDEQHRTSDCEQVDQTLCSSIIGGDDTATAAENRPLQGNHSKSDTFDEAAPSASASSSASQLELMAPRDQEVEALKQQLTQRETQLLSTSSVIQELHDELDKTCQREVAVVERNRFLTEQLELLRQEVLRLTRAVSHQQQQASHHHEVQALQQAVVEKDVKLQALLDEGQALSVKQSQLEHRLRQLRREKNDEEEQKLKLQAQSDTLAIQVQELTMKQKESDDETKTLLAELKSLAQNGDATTKQLMSVEERLVSSHETNEQLQMELQTFRDENETLREELDLLRHTSVSHANLSVEKNEMETTIQFLQQRVHDLESDASRREETARMEINDLKKKWKDALQRVDLMGQSVAEATQPLLRQIHALQDDQRGRQETWKATEATLLHRIADASAQRKVFESEKLLLDGDLESVRRLCDDLQLELQRVQGKAAREKERVESALQKEREAKSHCDALQIELDELKHKLHDELHVKQTMLLARSDSAGAAAAAVAATVAAETAKSEVDAAMQKAMAVEMDKLKHREEQLRHDLEWHQKELQRVKASSTSSPRIPSLQHRRSFDEDWVSSSSSANGSPRLPPASSSSGFSQASILQRTLDASADDSRLSSPSVLGLSQLNQRLRLREGENRLLKHQLQALDDKQKQTTDEIVRLSTRNALLESSASQFGQTQHELEQFKQKQHVLLELFGEKEEQVEELQAEVKELKAFYRKQLDTLASHQK